MLQYPGGFVSVLRDLGEGLHVTIPRGFASVLHNPGGFTSMFQEVRDDLFYCSMYIPTRPV